MSRPRDMCCPTCVYLLPDRQDQYPDHGHCHRGPPQLVGLMYGGVAPQVEQHYPWMTPTDWCGQHKFTHRPAPEAALPADGGTYGR